MHLSVETDSSVILKTDNQESGLDKSLAWLIWSSEVFLSCLFLVLWVCGEAKRGKAYRIFYAAFQSDQKLWAYCSVIYIIQWN